MLEIKGWSGSLEEVLAGPPMSAEDAFTYETVVKPAIAFQEHPDVAIRVLSGITLPPHERIILQLIHRGATSNVVIGSRGTSKTSVVDVLYANYKSLMFPGRQGVIISASGFRGGQLIFEDVRRWVNGQWSNQEAGLEFFRNSIKTGDGKEQIAHRAQNFWKIEYTSGSGLLTVPTNDPENLRGIRATDLYPDEANFTDAELLAKVADSFLNVLQDFAAGGDNADDNCTYYTTTVDYAWREFHMITREAYDGLRRELEALAAARRGDWAMYYALEKKKLHRTSYCCFDYTDTIVRRFITTRAGAQMEVHWPDTHRKWRRDRQGIPYTSRTEAGRMRQEGNPVEIIRTYPINRADMEGKLLGGEVSEPVWLAEQRNVVDSSAGAVYPHHVVDHAVCKGGKFLIPWGECGSAWQKAYPDKERHYKPTVMYECADPCVLGVDYAPGARDFCALVAIRVGPLATGEFNPLTGLGQTPWSNVIWTEQHRNASGRNIADKIRAFARRYNLIFFHNPYELDTWKLCRAIGIDCRGGGNTVRDDLVYINDSIVPVQEDGSPGYRIYDPLDNDPRLANFKTDGSAKPMLDAIMPTGPLNDKLVEFTVGQMTQHLLYLPADLRLDERPMDAKFDVGFTGARILEHQLRALQQKPTQSGYRTFFMGGDENDPQNKKDFWAAFIYAAKQLRAHLLRVRSLVELHLPMGALVMRGERALVGAGSSRVARGARRVG